MTEAVIVGQSHSGAIAQALALDPGLLPNISIYRLEDKKRPFERETVTLGEAVALVRELPANCAVFLSVLGTYHNIIGLLRSGPNFDFLIDSEDLPSDVERAWIPHRALAGAFEQNFALAKSVRDIKANSSSPVYLLSAPPPKRNNQFILDCLLRQKKQSYRGKTIREVGVQLPESRLKLWLLEARLAAAWASQRGMHFVPAPDQALDADGFLAEQFYYDDATHANAAYGALVIRQICDIIGEKRQEAVNG